MIGVDAGVFDPAVAGKQAVKSKEMAGSDRFGHAYHRLHLAADFAGIIIASVVTALFQPIAPSRPWFHRSIALIGEAPMVEVMTQRIDCPPEWGLRVGLAVVRLEGDLGWEVRSPSRKEDLADHARVSLGANGT
ncbi:MAG: hypothetical protein JJE13_04485 [Thermoleophilia bacterium]|nr:hypothetical protein [Thermoleophilia bacterium]